MPAELDVSVDPFTAALKRIDDALADMVALEVKLKGHKLVPPVDPRTWPEPGPPVMTDWQAPPRVRPGDPTPEQLWAAWSAGGVAWVEEADRRTAQALGRVMADPRDGRRFLDAPGLLGSLLAKLRPSARLQLAARLYFAQHPPHPALVGLSAEGTTARIPRWWARVGPALPSADRVAGAVAEAIRSGEAALPKDLDLPRLDAEGKWEVAIATARTVQSADHAEALLRFFDGDDLKGPAPVGPAAAVALRALAAAAERGDRNRRETGQQLSLRVGSPFGGDAGGRWAIVKDLLPKVRAWLAGEVLEVVFEHLRPAKPNIAHMPGPRKDFWKRYTGSVVQIWVAVSPAIKKRGALNHPDMKQIKEAMGSDLKVLDLKGQSEQALVWMHLQGADGGLLTVVEGNASTPVRMRAGRHSPTSGEVVNYQDEVLNGAFMPHVTGMPKITHNSGWEEHAERALCAHQVYPT
jgi:hypothetical protein